MSDLFIGDTVDMCGNKWVVTVIIGDSIYLRKRVGNVIYETILDKRCF